MVIDSIKNKLSKGLSPAQTMMQNVLKIKKGEKVLIVANPELNPIAQEVYQAALETG